MPETLALTSEWDKTFPKSEKVNHRKVTFHNRYGITLAADLYEPVSYSGKLAAIAVKIFNGKESRQFVSFCGTDDLTVFCELDRT